MEKIIFDKDKIKLSRVSIYDGSVCGVGFEQEGKKYFVHEAYGEDGEYIALYSVDGRGEREFICNKFADYDHGLDSVLDDTDARIEHKYANWKRNKVSKRGHSMKQALRSVPYKQYHLGKFADTLNYHFGAKSDLLQAKKQICRYIEISLSDLDSLKRYKKGKAVLDGHEDLVKDLKKAEGLLNKVIKAVESL